MKCPYCGIDDDKVVDSRSMNEGRSIRRRRECNACTKRLTTYEHVDNIPVMVIKKDKRREPYQRDKLTQGIRIACRKRPVSENQIEEIPTFGFHDAHPEMPPLSLAAAARMFSR